MLSLRVSQILLLLWLVVAIVGLVLGPAFFYAPFLALVAASSHLAASVASATLSRRVARVMAIMPVS